MKNGPIAPPVEAVDVRLSQPRFGADARNRQTVDARGDRSGGLPEHVAVSRMNGEGDDDAKTGAGEQSL